MKNNKNTIGRYKDILAIQSSYNNHIHFLIVDDQVNATWAGHASCNTPMTEEELSEQAKRWDYLINHDWSKHTEWCN